MNFINKFVLYVIKSVIIEIKSWLLSVKFVLYDQYHYIHIKVTFSGLKIDSFWSKKRAFFELIWEVWKTLFGPQNGESGQMYTFWWFLNKIPGRSGTYWKSFFTPKVQNWSFFDKIGHFLTLRKVLQIGAFLRYKTEDNGYNQNKHILWINIE